MGNTIAAILSLLAFLIGLHVMRMGLTRMAGSKLPAILKKCAKTPTRGIFTGTIITAVLQSSAAVTAITVGLVSGGSLLFRDALGIVLGANVGSTVTPQLLSINLFSVAIVCFIVGAAGLAIPRSNIRSGSMALVGFATIFIALQSLTLALSPFAKMPWFTDMLQQAGKVPFYAACAGCIASALMQSSTATTVMTMAFATNGMMTLPAAVAVVLGANVGTCLTSVIAAIGQTRAAQQVALSHVLLNVGGIAVMLPIIYPFSHFISLTAATPSQQIANAHTLFNLGSTLVVWPFTKHFASMIEWLLPDDDKS